ncbi:MAG: hypothetical protein H7293_05690 [Candidatus Saccharibacteria bacterium]|nr:hypothetical protein [Rhodoferax sp.]
MTGIAFLESDFSNRASGSGRAVNEAEPGVTAVAEVIRKDVAGAVLGTVSIGGPSARMSNSRIKGLGLLVVQNAFEPPA